MDYTYPSTYGGDCDGEDSVYYGGQTYRQIIISTIKQYLKTLNAGIDTSNSTATDIRSALDLHIDADSSIEANPIAIGSTGDYTDYVQTTLGDFAGAGSSPASKMAGKDNNCKSTGTNGETIIHVDNIIAQAGNACDTDAETAEGAITAMIGWGATISPTALVDEWFQAVADAAEERSINGVAVYDPTVAVDDREDSDKLPIYVTATGLDYQQLLQKFLLGAVTFSQGADDYLDQGLNASNAQSQGKCYSSLAHKWDEGYGYFGASRYYGQQTDAENKAGYKDQDLDDKLNLETEANYGHSVNAAKRDIGATVATDFTAGAFDAFKAGRDLIAGAGDTLTTDEMTELEGYRDAAISNWEKAISATVVHYINDVLADMDKFGTTGDDGYSFTTHAKHWGELKGFAMSFQFNPYSPMYGTADGETTTHFENFHTKVGTAPVLSTDTPENIAAYKTALEEARTLLQTAYGFDADNVSNW